MIKRGLSFLLFFSLLQIGNLQAREYDEDFLMQIIESGDASAIDAFFQSHRKYVSKTKHLIEFVEILREKVAIKYGYMPSWEEIYVAYKTIEPSLELPKEERKWLKNFLKQIVKKPVN